MKKDFITDNLGMYAFPDNNIVIKGDVSSTPITKKYLNQGTTIFTTADGTTGVLPNGQDVTLPSNTVLEMQYAQMGAQVDPQQQQQQQQLMQLISMYCQVVGGGDQSCAQKVAKSLEKNPEKMVQQMVAAVQQAQQQQQSEEGEEQMAKMGGCIECGEAFPQANMYPESWVGYTGTQYAVGGEAFPQAQTYLPYDRPGETRLNGMFKYGGEEYGGQADLESIYRVMKAGGLNKNPRKKRGFEETFDQYMMRMGGLPKHQAQQSQVGTGLTLPGYGLPELTIQGQAPQGVTMGAGLLQNVQTYGLPPGTTTINYPAGFQQWQAGQPGYTAPAYVPPTGSWRNPVGTINTNIQLPNVNRQASFAEQNPQAMTRIQQPQQAAGPAAGNARAQQQAAAQQAAAQQTTTSARAGTPAARSRTAPAQRNQEMMTMAPMLETKYVDIGFPDIQQPQSPQQPQYSPSPGASSRPMTGEELDEQGRRRGRKKSGFGPDSEYNVRVNQRQATNPYAAYSAGNAITNMFGNEAGAAASFANALGATLGSIGRIAGGRSRISYVDPVTGKRTRARNSAADIAAAGLFGMLPNQQSKQQVQPTAASTVAPQNTQLGYAYNVPHTGALPDVFPYRMESTDNPATFGQYGIPKRQPGGQGGMDFRYSFRDPNQLNYAPAAFSAGAASGFERNDMKQEIEDMQKRSALSGFGAPTITTATKTQYGAPQAPINASSFVPSTVVGSAPTDMYPLAPMNMQYTRDGGSILDYFEDGGTYDLEDMTPDERADLIERIYAAGGSVEFI